MFFEQLLFFVAGIAALGGAVGVVTLQNQFYSVLSLIAHLLGLAVLFLLLTAEFLAAAQVVVYAGAVMVMYLFVVAYIGGIDEPLRPESGALRVLGPLFAVVLFVELAVAVLGSSLSALDSRGPDVGDGFGTPGQIGELLLNRFLLPFEAASFLLLVAAVGAVVMARKRRGVYGHDEGAKGAISVREPMMEGADEPGRGARGGPAGRAY